MQLTNAVVSAKALLLVLPSILSFASSVTARSFPLNDGVNLRAGPGTTYAVVGSLKSGTYVDVVCQEVGQSVNGYNIWDKLSDGKWVFDKYVETGTKFVTDIPRCSETGGANDGNTFPINDNGVRVRSGPGTSFSQVGTLNKGDKVTIQCQGSGESVNGYNVWDKLTNGNWVFDKYVETGSQYVSGIPKCDEGNGGDNTFPINDNDVRVRSGPGTNYSQVDTLNKGDKVTIQCQGTGESVNGYNVWDKLSNGNWVFDKYVETGSQFVSGIPKCEGGGDSGNGGNGGNQGDGGSNNGHINQAGLDLVKSFEGWFPNFYIDPVGIKTIGYGHACHSDPTGCANIQAPLSVAQGEDLLRRDMAEFENCVSGLISASLTSNQFSALVSFSFNVGCGALRNSDMRRFTNQGNIGAAATEFGLWVHGGGRVLPGLVRRRKAERDLFCSGISC
ncbi:hypothetical protein K7432_012809 [Basidiobolus ranarum]|uniref:SH3b domain-containing protein n=1 Tax=Basidiobolus ranarum TaxID=34480 RepID=A0ABR2VSL1_9FUNG